MPEGLEERLRAKKLKKQTAAAKEAAGSLGSRTASIRSEGSSKIVGAGAEMNLDLGNFESNCPSASESETSQAHLGANPRDEPVPRTQDPGSVQAVNAKVLHDFKAVHAGAEERTIG